MLRAHIFDWIEMKQGNGLLLLLSVLVGVVFFTFAASLLYFRLYADLERDERQYQMIAKVGLSRKELRKIVTRQLLLMFFLPILVAVIHSSVAFTALQQIVSFPWHRRLSLSLLASFRCRRFISLLSAGGI